MDLFLCPAPAPSLSLHPCNLSDAQRLPDSAVFPCSVQPCSSSEMSYRSVVILHYIAHIRFCRGYLFRSFSVFTP